MLALVREKQEDRVSEYMGNQIWEAEDRVEACYARRRKETRSGFQIGPHPRFFLGARTGRPGKDKEAALLSLRLSPRPS